MKNESLKKVNGSRCKKATSTLKSISSKNINTSWKSWYAGDLILYITNYSYFKMLKKNRLEDFIVIAVGEGFLTFKELFH